VSGLKEQITEKLSRAEAQLAAWQADAREPMRVGEALPAIALLGQLVSIGREAVDDGDPIEMINANAAFEGV